MELPVSLIGESVGRGDILQIMGGGSTDHFLR